MKVLVWHWGRRGAGPRFAAELAAGLRGLPGVQADLSLSARAEILATPDAPPCAWPMPTYRGLPGFLARLAFAPLAAPGIGRTLRALAPDVAVCAMPAPLDGLMVAALRRAGVPYAVIVHDAAAHPGDELPFHVTRQARLLREAAALVSLSGHVADRLERQGLVGGRRLIRVAHPPFVFGPAPPPPGSQGGPLRLLSFGRLLPYKGLDLLADALAVLGARPDIEMRVVGSGPESAALARLRAMPGVRVENRWVPEAELPALLAWADALVLSHREASQSGVAAAALAARRWVVSTNVGGLAEQLRNEPLALMVEPNAAALAAGMARLAEAPPPLPPAPADPRAGWRVMATTLMAGLAGLKPAD